MILAALGSFQPNAPCSRSVGVIPNTREVLVTDAYVGVCCKAMKKVCENIKRQILRPVNGVNPPVRDTRFDGAVLPRYGGYPHNAVACSRITDLTCNPPATLITQWMRICLEASVERGDCRVIGMAPINLDIDAKFMNLIAAMTSSVRQRLQGLASGMTWTARSQVNVIVIPVRIAGNWCLYQIMRGSHT